MNDKPKHRTIAQPIQTDQYKANGLHKLNRNFNAQVLGPRVYITVNTYR